jgi:O-antigen ligase
MIDTSHMDLIWVILFTFVPMMISASLLRAKGVTGLLAIIGAISIGIVIFMDFHDFRLIIGGIAALLGLFVGGKISDARELAKMKRTGAEEKRRRESMLRGR